MRRANAMSLPDLIEIVPPAPAVQAEITVPGSKSITNRALVLAALAAGETELRGALWSEDTEIMVECLRELGFLVTVAPDPAEPGNRVLTVYGQGGRVPRGGTAAQPLELFVGNAGTAARFLAAMVCLGEGAYRLRGVPRMHERPQAGLFAALRELGCRVESPNDRLPAVIHGTGPQPGAYRVSVAESSQFASALLLCARAGRWEIAVTGDNAGELPYVEMTRQLVAAFPAEGGRFDIEADASSGSYFLAADWLLGGAGRVRVARWPASGWQVDARFPRFLPLPDTVSRARDLGDSILTAMVLAPFAERPVRFTDLGRLRVQECERVAAMRTELTRCGARVVEEADTLTVFPAAAGLHGNEIETYQDHRVAMSFAILGLKVPGIKIKNPPCVRKTFPSFFQKLAAPPPRGLGVELRDPATGRRLGWEELAGS
jgi:3-phosphoshikimate 1-carboxyvinyltransferase